jgi:hypothetical protein
VDADSDFIMSSPGLFAARFHAPQQKKPLATANGFQ